MAQLFSRQELMDEIRAVLVRLCKNAVVEGFVARVDGLIGVTLDNDNVFLVNIQEEILSNKDGRVNNHEPAGGQLFDGCLGKTTDANNSTDVASESSRLNSGAYPNAGSHQAESVSKIDMLVRYSSNLFDQLSNRKQGTSSNFTSDQMADRHRRRGKVQSPRSNERPRGTRFFEDYQQQVTTYEKDYQYDMNQCLNIKEEPASHGGLEESMSSGQLLNSDLSSWNVKSDDSGKSMSLGQSTYVRHGNDSFSSDQLIGEEPKPGEASLLGYPPLPQQQQQPPPWLANAFEAFPMPNGLGEAVENRPFVCELCDASFSKKFCLANHIVTIHQVGGKYVCKHCGKQFLQKLRYLTHVDRHNNIRRHVCQFCGKAFSYKYSLWSHAKKCLSNTVDAMAAVGNEMEPDGMPRNDLAIMDAASSEEK